MQTPETFNSLELLIKDSEEKYNPERMEMVFDIYKSVHDEDEFTVPEGRELEYARMLAQASQTDWQVDWLTDYAEKYPERVEILWDYCQPQWAISQEDWELKQRLNKLRITDGVELAERNDSELLQQSAFSSQEQIEQAKVKGRLVYMDYSNINVDRLDDSLVSPKLAEILQEVDAAVETGYFVQSSGVRDASATQPALRDICLPAVELSNHNFGNAADLKLTAHEDNNVYSNVQDQVEIFLPEIKKLYDEGIELTFENMAGLVVDFPEGGQISFEETMVYTQYKKILDAIIKATGKSKDEVLDQHLYDETALFTAWDFKYEGKDLNRENFPDNFEQIVESLSNTSDDELKKHIQITNFTPIFHIQIPTSLD